MSEWCDGKYDQWDVRSRVRAFSASAKIDKVCAFPTVAFYAVVSDLFNGIGFDVMRGGSARSGGAS